MKTLLSSRKGGTYRIKESGRRARSAHNVALDHARVVCDLTPPRSEAPGNEFSARNVFARAHRAWIAPQPRSKFIWCQLHKCRKFLLNVSFNQFEPIKLGNWTHIAGCSSPKQRCSSRSAFLPSDQPNKSITGYCLLPILHTLPFLAPPSAVLRQTLPGPTLTPVAQGHAY